MASDRNEHFFHCIEEKAKKFSREATALSDNIVRLEQRLRGLPGNEPVEVTENDITLAFGDDSGNWSLWLTDSQSPTAPDGERTWGRLREVSIERKAGAIQLLPALLEQVAKVQEKKLKSVQNSLDEANALLKHVLAEPEEV
ncbi:MAG: hypothetical protein V3T53_14470 [Phycisphaerales bacterium]